MKRMKRIDIVLLLVLFLTSTSAFSQISLQWVKQLGGGFDVGRPLGPNPSADGCISRKAYSVTTDNQNNIFVAGYYADSTDFGNGVWMIPPINHMNVLFLAKYDSAGNFLFVKNFYGIGNPGGGHRFDNVFIRADAEGNTYMAAWLRGGQTDLDPGPGTFSGQHNKYYLIKLTASGDFVNAVQLPLPLTGVSDPGTIAKNYKLTAGHFYMKDQSRIYRYNQNLNLDLTLDVRSSSGLANNEFNSCLITSLEVDADGLIYCSILPFGPTGCVMDNSKPWLIKYSANGTRIWRKPFISTEKISLYKNRIRASGYLPYQLQIDADPGPDSFLVSGSADFRSFIADFDTSGQFMLARTVNRFAAGKNYNRSGHALAQRILATNSIGDMNTTNDSLRYQYEGQSGTGTFLARGITDFVVSLSDDYDNLISLVHFGGVGDEVVYDWTADRSGNIIVVGTFSDADDCDYDPGPGTVKLINTNMVPDPVFNNRVSTAIFVLKLKMNP
jgi:hypothetical protein